MSDILRIPENTHIIEFILCYLTNLVGPDCGTHYITIP